MKDQDEVREAFYKAKERLYSLSEGSGAVARFWHEQGIEQGYQAATAAAEEKYLGVIRELHEALKTAKSALSMLGSEIPNLKAVRSEHDSRLATPANYAADLARMAKGVMEPAIALAAPLLGEK